MATGYDVAQICLNGHVITDSLRSYPHHGKKFCDQCGEGTISKCSECSTPIQGHYHVDGVIGFSHDYRAPSFCHECGSPFPWTVASIEAAKELADEIDGLSDEEREQFRTSVEQIVSDNPRTSLAASRIKRFLGKAGAGLVDTAKDIIVRIAVESAQKGIFGP